MGLSYTGKEGPICILYRCQDDVIVELSISNGTSKPWAYGTVVWVSYVICQFPYGSVNTEPRPSTLQQLSDDTSDTALIENNGVAPGLGLQPFWSNSIVFNKSSITLATPNSNTIFKISNSKSHSGLKLETTVKIPNSLSRS